jgi:hypothetical protein
VLSITIVSDTPNCGVTYDRHNDNRNSFIIQAIGVLVTRKHFQRNSIYFKWLLVYANLAENARQG